MHSKRQLKKDLFIRQQIATQEEIKTIQLAKKNNNELKEAHTSRALKPKISIILNKPSEEACQTLKNSFVITQTDIFYVNEIGMCSKIALGQKKSNHIFSQLPYEAFKIDPLSISEVQPSLNNKDLTKITNILNKHKNKILKNSTQRKDQAKRAMVILGIQGVFKLNSFTQIRGAGFNSFKIRKYLADFPYQSINESKNQDLIDKIQFFKKATAIQLKSKGIKQRLMDGQAVEIKSGWKGKRPHCVGLLAFIERNTNCNNNIKLIHCNRGPSSAFCIGNTVFCADLNDDSLTAISELITKDLKFSNKNEFYHYFNKKLTEGGFVLKYSNHLKKQKMGNCSFTNQKSLLAAILPKEAYKKVTTELRKAQIDYLLEEIKAAANKNKDISNHLEFTIIQAYLQQKTVTALTKNNKRKLELIEYIISELKTIHSNKNKRVIKAVINKHQELRILFKMKKLKSKETALQSQPSFFKRKQFTCKTMCKNNFPVKKRKFSMLQSELNINKESFQRFKVN